MHALSPTFTWEQSSFAITPKTGGSGGSTCSCWEVSSSLTFNSELTLKKGNYSRIRPNKEDKIDIKNLQNIKFDQYKVKIEDKETDKRIKDIAKSQKNFESRSSYLHK